MSRHRNVRSYSYSDDYDDEDEFRDEEDLSPTQASFIYNRNTNEQVESEKKLKLKSPDDEELNTVKLYSCLEELYDIIGGVIPESMLIDIIIQHNFDIQQSLNAALNYTTNRGTRGQRRKNRAQKDEGITEEELEVTDCDNIGGEQSSSFQNSGDVDVGKATTAGVEAKQSSSVQHTGDVDISKATTMGVGAEQSSSVQNPDDVDIGRATTAGVGAKQSSSVQNPGDVDIGRATTAGVGAKQSSLVQNPGDVDIGKATSTGVECVQSCSVQNPGDIDIGRGTTAGVGAKQSSSVQNSGNVDIDRATTAGVGAKQSSLVQNPGDVDIDKTTSTGVECEQSCSVQNPGDVDIGKATTIGVEPEQSSSVQNPGDVDIGKATSTGVGCEQSSSVQNPGDVDIGRATIIGVVSEVPIEHSKGSRGKRHRNRAQKHKGITSVDNDNNMLRTSNTTDNSLKNRDTNDNNTLKSCDTNDNNTLKNYKTNGNTLKTSDIEKSNDTIDNNIQESSDMNENNVEEMDFDEIARKICDMEKNYVQETSDANDYGRKNSCIMTKSGGNMKTNKPPEEPDNVRAILEGEEAYKKERGKEKPNLYVIVIGHVDAGKSTVMGHLLYKLGYVNKKTMHKYEAQSKKAGKQSFLYAWILDETEEERYRGITMDIGQSRFETTKKNVILLDAPGHKDFIPNMISGATQADVGILIVDATVGEFETGFESGGQTREHAILIRSLGICQLGVVINKMDNVMWSKKRFGEICRKLQVFLQKAGYRESDLSFIPCSGLMGENLTSPPVHPAAKQWYNGPTLMGIIEKFRVPVRDIVKPFRMTVTDIFKGSGPGFCISGRVESGMIRVGNKVLVNPYEREAIVKGVSIDGVSKTYIFAGDYACMAMGNYDVQNISLGNVLSDLIFPVTYTNRFEGRIVVFNVSSPLVMGSVVTLHIHSVVETAVIHKLVAVLDKCTGQIKKRKPRYLPKNCTAVVMIETAYPICLELYSDVKELGRFMLRIDGVTVAAGLITDVSYME